jgi:hypothetical protein
MLSNVQEHGLHAAALVTRVCPQAPPGAQAHVDNILGYVLWGVGILFFVGLVVGVGAVVGGRIFSMPHAGTVGVISLVTVFVAAIAYLILPGMLEAMLGSGCV